MDIVLRRKGLAAALTAHDAAAVQAFLDPSFVVRGADGMVAMEYGQLLEHLPAFFKGHPEYEQTVEIEASKMEGDVATLTTRRHEVLRVLWASHLVSSRWNETWKRRDGEWFLTEEKPNSS